MTSREDIALQLTLKAIEHMSIPHSNTHSSCEQANSDFSNQIADFYNTVYDKIKTYR